MANGTLLCGLYKIRKEVHISKRKTLLSTFPIQKACKAVSLLQIKKTCTPRVVPEWKTSVTRYLRQRTQIACCQVSPREERSLYQSTDSQGEEWLQVSNNTTTYINMNSIINNTNINTNTTDLSWRAIDARRFVKRL